MPGAGSSKPAYPTTQSSAEPYRFNVVHRIHVPSAQPSADEESPPEPSSQEGRLLAILHAAADLSHGSEELLGFISDDFTRLHLSPERPNFLQPFREFLHGRILVIGSSIGPLARFVAEHGAEVHAVEPDFAHAVLAAARCRDLNNVLSYVGDYPSALPDTTPYDVIIATEPADPSITVENCLGRLRNVLVAHGLLIVAMNNSLGMPILTDAGTSGSTARDRGWRLGKLRVDEVFAVAGFQDVRLFTAFPSPEFCRLIIGPDWSAERTAGLESILAAYDHYPSTSRLGRQSLWKSALQNGLLTHLGNSFVITASLQCLPKASGCHELGIYSSFRRKHFAKVTVIHLRDAELLVSRRPLFPNAAPPAGSLFRLRAYEEPYFPGKPYLFGLQEVLDREGWQPKDIAVWARPWLDLLDAKASNETFLGYIGGIAHLRVLPPIYVDCIPDNVQVSKNGELFPIDFEYEAVAPIPLHFVIYRGLRQALSAVTCAAPPKPTYANISDLTVEVMRIAGIALNENEVRNYDRIEAALQNSVAAAPFSESEVDIRCAVMRARQIDMPPPTPPPGSIDVLQVFWKMADSQYKEEASAATAIVPGQLRQLISVVLPPIDPPPDSLRLDPCTRAGVFYLFSLQLFDSLGQSIWAWDGDRVRLTSKRDLVFIDIPFQSGAIVYSEGIDPSLEMPVSSDVLRRLFDGGRLEVEMSWPESPDNLMISQRILSVKGYRDQILSLEAANRALTQSRDGIAALHDDLRSRYDTMARELAHARDQNAALTETHEHLTTTLSEWAVKEDRLKKEQSALREENERLAAEIESLGTREDPNLASAVILNTELQKHVRILKEELRNVSGGRSALRNEKGTLDAQLNHLQQQITTIYQSRIWRILVAVSSPFSSILVRIRGQRSQ